MPKRDEESIETKMRELLDKQDIHETLLRYCRAIDRHDEELLRSVYHPDAMDNHGIQNGTASEFIAWAMKTLHENDRTTHLISNVMIELHGNTAHSESYFLTVVRRQIQGRFIDVTIAGRYLDLFERRGSHWKIARRQVVIDWNRVDPVEGSVTLGQFVLGKRSREDLVYKEGLTHNDH
ncbi:MAG: nuclear transport factor 2 family protein [Candidatus Sulfotelmatobacter sp.]